MSFPPIKYLISQNISKICNEKLANASDAINKIVNEDGSIEDFKANEEGE